MTASPSQCQPNPLDELYDAKAALSAVSRLLTTRRDLSDLGENDLFGLAVIFRDIDTRMERVHDILMEQHRQAREAVASPMSAVPAQSAAERVEGLLRGMAAAMPRAADDDGAIYPRLDAVPEAEAVPPLAATA